ncbi:MAG: hypothetical protein IJC25_01545 [Clostridia bacterium]|nr:hypothetical protein [Clostridia bacterium]
MKIRSICTALCAMLLLGGCAPQAPSSAPSAFVSMQTQDYKVHPVPHNPAYSYLYTADQFSVYDCKKGLADAQGNVIFDIVYDAIGVTKNGIFILLENEGDLYTVVDRTGKELGRYTFISCHNLLDGNSFEYEATFSNAEPHAPYIAQLERSDGERDYWLLDENFNRLNSSPYEDMGFLWDETGTRLGAAVGGVRYELSADGEILTAEQPYSQMYFNGKYTVFSYCRSAFGEYYSHGVKAADGSVIIAPDYSRIEIPLEHRFVLYEGHEQSIGGSTATLTDSTGKVLTRAFHKIRLYQTENGVVGIGQRLGELAERPAYDADGNELTDAGFWFIDADGNPVSQRYETIWNAEEYGWKHLSDMLGDTLFAVDGNGNEITLQVSDLAK